MVKNKVSMPIQDAFSLLEKRVNTVAKVVDELIINVRDLQNRTHSLNQRLDKIDKNKEFILGVNEVK